MKKHRNNLVTHHHKTIDFSFSLHSTEKSIRLRVDDEFYEEPLPCGMTRIPGKEYEIRDRGERDILVFCYDHSHLPFFQNSGILPELPIWHYPASAAMQKMIPEILDIAAHIAEPGQADRFDLSAVSCLMMTRSFPEPRSGDAFYQNIIHKIESQMLFNSKSHHSLEQIIKNSGISRRSFFRYWKMYHQESPHDFMRNCLLSDAEQLLAETSLSIHEIAARLGFRNPSHFFVLFKKYVGVSPLQYRKSLNSKP
jgi:AraC-like DNA-binding protein